MPGWPLERHVTIYDAVTQPNPDVAPVVTLRMKGVTDDANVCAAITRSTPPEETVRV